MLVEKIRERFNNSSDLIIKKIKGIYIVFLESSCSSDKINEYVTMIVSLKKGIGFKLNDLISGPNTKECQNIDDCINLLVNGFALVIERNKALAIEVKADINRGVDIPQTQQSIYGPKDSFTESIQMNLGLIKRRIKSSHLINEDFCLGKYSKTKVSILYIDDICEQDLVRKVRKKIKEIDIDGLIDSGVLTQLITKENSSALPTVTESERPDRVATELLEGKVAILVDTSPFVIILPSFFTDFINPKIDDYNKSININFLKIMRFMCLLITILLPGLYVALTNYNHEIIPLNLLINFASQREGVPFPAAIECFIMLFMCEILRESDIRFPSSYGSSISILGALILGEASVSAGIVSPIMIIIVAITFITSLVFTELEMINSLRIFRFSFLFAATLGGLYATLLVGFGFLSHVCSIKSFGKPYTYPLAPFDKVYFKKTVIKGKTKNDKYRSKMLTRKNLRKQGDNNG